MQSYELYALNKVKHWLKFLKERLKFYEVYAELPNFDLMSKKLLIFIIILVGLALSGIIYVQISYMKNAYTQNETLFDYKVNDALQSMVKNLEQLAIIEKIHVELQKKKLKPQWEPRHEKEIDIQIDSFFNIRFNDSLFTHINLPDAPEVSKMIYSINDENIVVVSSHQEKNRGRTVISSNSNVYTKDQNYLISRQDSNFLPFRHIKPEHFRGLADTSFSFTFTHKIDGKHEADYRKAFADKKEKQIKKVVNKMVMESDKKLVKEIKRLNYLLIDSLLRASLKNHHIKLAYEYKVLADSDKVKEIPVTKGFDLDTKHKMYEALLFPNDIVPKSDKLILYFPERNNHLVKSLSILLPSSLVFSLIIVIAFSISIMMVLKQKKISDIKTDFINNMTHEFKTPIATISLAADTIVNPRVIGDQNKINQFIRIIKDENKRMNLQVERILQMAQLERKEFELKQEWLDINQLIDKALANIDMQLKQLNGKINTKYNTKMGQVYIDEIHFTNVINNLLDNALKYTISPPEILIHTSEFENGIVLSFEDKGMGMSKEVQSRIFDKFYRVSSGNIHNIKGFGLGLSYVKAIVEAHGGRISVKSEQNKGSRFTIYLPQKLKENGKFA